MNTDEIKAPDEFYTVIEEKLCPAASAKDFESDPEIVTRTLDWYEDYEEHQNHMPEVDEIMPEVMEIFIGAEIIISNGDTVAQGSGRRRKGNVDGNTIGRSNMNPILYTRTYEVGLKDRSMSTYSANVIAESMYSHCDEEGHKYIWFGSILYHNTDGNALSVADQDVAVRGRSLKCKTTKGWRLCVK